MCSYYGVSWQHELQALHMLAWSGDIPELWGTLRMFAARPG